MSLSRVRLDVFRAYLHGMSEHDLDRDILAERIGADALAKAYLALRSQVVSYLHYTDDDYPELGTLADLLSGAFDDSDFDDQYNGGTPLHPLGIEDLTGMLEYGWADGEGDEEAQDLYDVLLGIEDPSEEDEILEDEE